MQIRCFKSSDSLLLCQKLMIFFPTALKIPSDSRAIKKPLKVAPQSEVSPSLFSSRIVACLFVNLVFSFKEKNIGQYHKREIRELKKQRRRRQQQRNKTMISLVKKNINNRAARAARILANIFEVLCITTT